MHQRGLLPPQRTRDQGRLIAAEQAGMRPATLCVGRISFAMFHNISDETDTDFI